VDDWAHLPAVVVLVGTSGSGKTTLRRALVARGMPTDVVVSLDDLRHQARRSDAARGRPVRPLQDYSAIAVRAAGRRYDALAAFGTGYLADATHLRRRDRTPHLRTAAEAGLVARAVLTPLLSLEELVRRNDRRAVEEQVPVGVLARQAHRRSLLSAELLAAEGFTRVHEIVPT
jgi:predicted kinase